MLDAVSLDQLRVFIVSVEEGSFSAAARKLNRAQSAVSELIAKLEEVMGVSLFDRSGRYPRLTPAGQALLGDAKTIVAGVDGMKARAREISAGLEPELSVVIDAFFPLEAVAEAAKDFRGAFPGVPLRLYMETLCGAFQTLLKGRASIGAVPVSPMIGPDLKVERIMGVNRVIVAARDHPLALLEGAIPKRELARHTQLVLTDRSEGSAGRDFGVFSPLTWRLADLHAKRVFLLNGLGWGGMPSHVVAEDIAAGRLVTLDIEDLPVEDMIFEMAAVYPLAMPPGPAGRWFIERLRAVCDHDCAFKAKKPYLSAISA